MRLLVQFAAGILFAIGLGISRMTDANVVLAFLDLSGAWDPSLIVVMGGAVLSYAAFVAVAERRSTPLFSARFEWPQKNDIDQRLLAGAVLFGWGWGLAGFCPGPAITSALPVGGQALVFAAAMLVGVALFHGIEHWRRQRSD